MIDNLLKMIKTAQIYNFCNILLLIFRGLTLFVNKN